jgi:hypothetical protein
VNTIIRVLIYLASGVLLMLLNEITNTRLGWSMDIAWLIIVSAAFAWPSEMGPISGMLFGLTLDGLSGAGSLVYTITYGGMGLLVLLIRKAFYLKGFVASWIVAVLGAEILWLLLGVFSQANVLLGGNARFPGWFSPFIFSSVFIYPVVYLGVTRLLRQPVEQPRATYYSTSKVIKL